MRTSPGHYTIAPARPEPPKPAPSPDPPAVRSDGMTDQMWLDALEAWHIDPSTWNVVELGPLPDRPNHRIPPDIVMRMNDRLRKREERRRERDAAAARQAAADAELRKTLLAAANGNFQPGPGLDDMSPVRAILELVPIDYILYAIRQKVDKRCFPGNPPLASWRDPKFLRAVADNYCSGVVIPSMVAAWEAAGKAPATKAHGSSPPAGHTPDDVDNLRRHHDLEHAPPGPHSLPKPPAASAAPGVTGKPVERVEPSPAVEASP